MADQKDKAKAVRIPGGITVTLLPKSEPMPVFQKEGIRPAIAFQRAQGKLRRRRRPPKRPPSRIPEVEYFRRMSALIAQLQVLVNEKVIPRLPGIVGGAPRELRARQDVGEILEESISDLRLAFAGIAPLEALARRAGNEAEGRNRREQKRIVETVLGIRPEIGEPWLADLMRDFTKANAQLIGRVTDDFIDRVERRISTRVREGVRAEEIQREIERDFISSQGLEVQIAKRRAKLIARDQIASLQGDITRVRQQAIGVRRYIWRTAQDERVRSTHRQREGQIFVWDEPIGPQLDAKGLKIDTVDGPPGKPINCRCYAEPILDDLVPEAPEI